jgi:hypothetical protein
MFISKEIKNGLERMTRKADGQKAKGPDQATKGPWTLVG